MIEDDRSIGAIYSLRLRQDGWNVEVVGSGEDGVERALAEPPDVVLLDIMLPGIDGVEVLRRLRVDKRTKEVPVLVLSNSPGLAGKLKRAHQLGIIGWRVKASTTPRDLAAALRSLLPMGP